MPNLTVTLTDAQWAAYQAVSGNPSLENVTAWLKGQLSMDYQIKLEVVDRDTANDVGATAAIARATKVEAF